MSEGLKASEVVEIGGADQLSYCELKELWGYQFRNRLVDYREKHVDATPEEAFQVIESVFQDMVDSIARRVQRHGLKSS